MDRRILVAIAVVLTAIISGSIVYYYTQMMARPEVRIVRWADADVFPTDYAVGMLRAEEEELAAQGIVLERFGMQEPTDAIKMLEAGTVDFAAIMTGPFFAARLEGIDIKFIAGAQNGLPFYFVTPNAIQTPSDLNGKILAHHGVGGMSWVVMMAVLEAKGIDPDTMDIRIIPGSENRRAALLAGQIDGTIVDTPNCLYLLDTGDYHIFGQATDLYPDLIGNVWIAKTDYIEENRDLLIKIFSAYFKAIKFYQENMEEYLDAAGSMMPEYDRELHRASWEIEAEFLRADGGLTQSTYESTVEVYINKLQQAASAPSYSAGCDDSIVKAAGQ
ncbi:MAG: ABC transporter substrate-binding protein [Candidatus Hodarchaeota archaeon]